MKHQLTIWANILSPDYCWHTKHLAHISNCLASSLYIYSGFYFLVQFVYVEKSNRCHWNYWRG